MGNESEWHMEWVLGARDMTLRDWLAGMAMQGYVQNGSYPDVAAIRGYELADAMLKERDKKKE